MPTESSDDEVERLIAALGGVINDEVAGLPSTVLALRHVLNNHVHLNGIFERHSSFSEIKWH